MPDGMGGSGRNRSGKAVSAFEPVSDQPDRWFSKHGVQTAIALHLMNSGWQLRWVGDCLERDVGHPEELAWRGEPLYDLDAERDGVQLLVEAVGHPGSLDGPRDGQRAVRPGLTTQGRRHAFPRYSDALFSGPAMRRQYPDARIAQAFPIWGLYRTYVPRAYAQPNMRAMNVELWMVDKDGEVTESVPADR